MYHSLNTVRAILNDRYRFCWVCMGPWSEHGNAWYTCNRFDEKDSIEARDSQSKSRASLERYLFVRTASILDVRVVTDNYCSTTIDTPTTSSLPSCRSISMRRPRGRWRKCRLHLISPGLKYSLRRRLSMKLSSAGTHCSGRTPWPSIWYVSLFGLVQRFINFFPIDRRKVPTRCIDPDI